MTRNAIFFLNMYTAHALKRLDNTAVDYFFAFVKNSSIICHSAWDYHNLSTVLLHVLDFTDMSCGV